MSLISKTVLWILLISILVFGIGGVVAYNLIKKEIQIETDYHLRTQLSTLEKQIANGADYRQLLSDRIFINQTGIAGVDTVIIQDTLAKHPQIGTMESFRKLVALKSIDDTPYSFTIIDVIVEESDIYDSTVGIITRLFIMLALAVIIGGFFISKFLLSPFNGILQAIDTFQINQKEPLHLPDTKTREFSRLNQFLSRMTEHIKTEYQTLKTFSENASHEMQTPLAIALGKLDLLMDDNSLTESQFQNVQSAQLALKRLSTLGKSLSLLTKIENQEFDPNAQVDFSTLVKDTIENFKELYAMNDITLQTNVQPGVKINMDKKLGVILLNNLFGNSLKHNDKNGFVRLDLNSSRLSIENSGSPPPHNPDLLFHRFIKNPEKEDSTGLGLAIVKEICDFYELTITYTYRNFHRITISF